MVVTVDSGDSLSTQDIDFTLNCIGRYETVVEADSNFESNGTQQYTSGTMTAKEHQQAAVKDSIMFLLYPSSGSSDACVANGTAAPDLYPTALPASFCKTSSSCALFNMSAQSIIYMVDAELHLLGCACRRQQRLLHMYI